MRVVKPTAYIGPVGSLVPFLGPSTESISGGREVSFEKTLGRRKAFLGRVRAREWSCELDTRYPEELAGLQYLAEYSDGPLVWYPADALFGNMLTPDVAAFAPDTHTGLDGPLAEVEPGVWVPSAFGDGRNLTAPFRNGSLDPVPVVPGVPVTLSVWLRGGDVSGDQAQISVFWRDAQGLGVETVSPRFPGTEGFVRRSVTLTPPPGAVQFSYQLWCAQAAGLAVTLTDAVMPHSPGKGAKRVIAHGLSETIKLVTQYPDARDLSGLSFTVSEVG